MLIRHRTFSTEPFADNGGRRECILDHVGMVLGHGAIFTTLEAPGQFVKQGRVTSHVQKALRSDTNCSEMIWTKVCTRTAGRACAQRVTVWGQSWHKERSTSWNNDEQAPAMTTSLCDETLAISVERAQLATTRGFLTVPESFAKALRLDLSDAE
ncbi:hypothetical protein JOM56_009385 [Amanita muscaria]